MRIQVITKTPRFKYTPETTWCHFEGRIEDEDHTLYDVDFICDNEGLHVVAHSKSTMFSFPDFIRIGDIIEGQSYDVGVGNASHDNHSTSWFIIEDNSNNHE